MGEILESYDCLRHVYDITILSVVVTPDTMGLRRIWDNRREIVGKSYDRLTYGRPDGRTGGHTMSLRFSAENLTSS